MICFILVADTQKLTNLDISVIKHVVKLLKIQFCNEQGWHRSIETIEGIPEMICKYLIQFYKQNQQPTLSSSAPPPNFTKTIDELNYLVRNAACQSNAIDLLQNGLFQAFAANEVSHGAISIQSIYSKLQSLNEMIKQLKIFILEEKRSIFFVDDIFDDFY